VGQGGLIIVFFFWFNWWSFTHRYTVTLKTLGEFS
jgi:hypothetical protein